MKNNRELSWFDNKLEELQKNFSHIIKVRERINPRLETLKIIAIYIVLGGLWILLSDTLLSTLIKDENLLKQFQLYKGWFYVIITAFAFYAIIKNRLVLFEDAVHTIFQGYEELTAVNEQLIAMEEELTNQYEQLREHKNALEISEQRYQLAVEGANDGIWDWDLTNDDYFSSKKWAELFGYKEETKGDNLEVWLDLLHPEDSQRIMDEMQDYLASGKGIYHNTYRVKNQDGKYNWVLSRGKAIWDSEGRPIRVAGSHTDITQQMELHETLRKEKQISEGIINEAPTIIIVTDISGNIIKFNPFAEKLTGYSKEDVLGTNAINLLIPQSKQKDVKYLFTRVIQGEELNSGDNILDLICKSGELVKILWDRSLLYNNEDKVQEIIFIGMDVTERINLEKKLHLLAYYDPVTHLPNRAAFEEETKKLINKSKKEGKKLAIIYLDVDNFKHINDTLGHGAGDEFIAYIGNTLAGCIESPNIVSRLGGDEFTITLVDIKDENQVIEKIHCLLGHIRKPWIKQNHKFYTTVSMGVVIYPDHGKDMAELMQNADAAMFDVKENGKDGYCIFTSHIKEKTLRHVQMSNELRTAIDKEEFILYYQPQVELNTNKIIGVEALIRWVHPEKGFIPPIEFITFAEETGYIDEIGQWVLKTACRQRVKWGKLGYKNLKISVNLSGKELTKENLIDNIEKMLKENNIGCRHVEVEITETAIMTNLEQAIRVLKQLKQLGLTIALDDFGTGYSSLTYLQKLPIDVLKVDREFIKNIIDKDEDLHIFRAIIELAGNLGLKVVAEGIETREQLEFLIANGCNIGQGYYFSKPLPALQMEGLLSQQYKD